MSGCAHGRFTGARILEDAGVRDDADIQRPGDLPVYCIVIDHVVNQLAGAGCTRIDIVHIAASRIRDMMVNIDLQRSALIELLRVPASFRNTVQKNKRVIFLCIFRHCVKDRLRAGDILFQCCGQRFQVDVNLSAGEHFPQK